MNRLSAFFLAFVLVLLLTVAPSVAGETEYSVTDLGETLAAKYRGRVPVQWGEHFPGVLNILPPARKIHDASRTLALTLDACEGDTDRRIIALLRKHSVPATLFVTNRWLARNKVVAADLAADPLFAFACHGKRHKPASVNGRKAYGIAGTRSVQHLVEEVEDNARAITALTGERPRWYRSGTAHYDDVAVAVIADLGLSVAGYTVSADQGASLPAGDVARRLARAPDLAVILLHLNHPESGTFQGLASAIPKMIEHGVRFVKLE